MTLPWLEVDSLPAAEFTRVRRRAIFDCCKWDAQVEDVCAVAPFPLVLRASAWRELAALARALAAETLAAEAELLARPGLHTRLGLPRGAIAALRRAADTGTARGAARLIRFDFHHTNDGWRISEANTDVPGGINEASGFPALFTGYYRDTQSAGDPAGALAHAFLQAAGAGARVALLHATAYSDDRQVMTYIGRRVEAAGMTPVLASPAHVRWHHGRAQLESAWSHEGVDVTARFFPAEWLCELPAYCPWQHFFAGSDTPASNPAGALLTQSKRFPLVWDELTTALPTWRRLLPETRDPADVRRNGTDEWVLKPALGRVGEGVAIPGVMPPQEWSRVQRHARRTHADWVAQQRFVATPFDTPDGARYPCVGVFTVDECVVGAYGRIARQPLIDWRAQDIAVLASGAE